MVNGLEDVIFEDNKKVLRGLGERNPRLPDYVSISSSSFIICQPSVDLSMIVTIINDIWVTISEFEKHSPVS